MKMQIKTRAKLSLLTVAVLASLGVQAQSLPEPLVQAARKAVASNPEVQARWNAFKAAGDERGVARGGFFPKVDFTASVGRESRVTPLADYGSYNIAGRQLTLNQMLFDGLFTPSEVKRLGYARLTRYYELADISETTALGAVQAYADVVRYRELVDAATQNYVEHKQTFMHVEERANAGVGRRADVEQATGRLALAESNLLTELTNLHDVSARYLRIVGEKPPESLPSLPDPFKLSTLPDAVDVLMRDGLQGSPALNAAVENVRASKQAIESSKAAYMPRLDIRAYRTWDSNLLGSTGDTDVNGAQLVLNYNLFRGGADKAKNDQAVNLKEQARDLQEKTCREVRQTLAIAYSDVNSLNKQLSYRDQHRLSTEKSREAYRQQFDIGQRTLLDLLDSQNEYFEATRAYINARYNQIAAQARTLAGMGRLVAALGVTREDVPNAQDAGQDRNGIDPSELCPLEGSPIPTIDKIMADAVIPPRARVALPVAAAAPAPAPKAAAAPVVAGKKISLAADALFDFDKADLKPGRLASLENLASHIKDVNMEVVIAVGHTDAIGNDAYNNRLSRARAESVKAYLVSKGIDANRIKTEGRGKTQPVADNATAQGRARNRRVDVEVVEARGAAR